MHMAIVDGKELETLIKSLRAIADYRAGVHTLRFVVEGGIKVKVNEGMWSAAYGRIADSGGY